MRECVPVRAPRHASAVPFLASVRECVLFGRQEHALPYDEGMHTGSAGSRGLSLTEVRAPSWRLRASAFLRACPGAGVRPPFRGCVLEQPISHASAVPFLASVRECILFGRQEHALPELEHALPCPSKGDRHQTADKTRHKTTRHQEKAVFNAFHGRRAPGGPPAVGRVVNRRPSCFGGPCLTSLVQFASFVRLTGTVHRLSRLQEARSVTTAPASLPQRDNCTSGAFPCPTDPRDEGMHTGSAGSRNPSLTQVRAPSWRLCVSAFLLAGWGMHSRGWGMHSGAGAHTPAQVWAPAREGARTPEPQPTGAARRPPRTGAAGPAPVPPRSCREGPRSPPCPGRPARRAPRRTSTRPRGAARRASARRR